MAVSEGADGVDAVADELEEAESLAFLASFAMRVTHSRKKCPLRLQ